MHIKIKKLILLIIISIYIVPNTIFAYTYDNWPVYKENILSEASVVLDAGSNVILYEKNPDKKMYPASITKIMTALVVMDKIKNYDEEVFFTYNACNNGIDKNSTTIGASAGDRLTVKECLYAILLPSANDAANALAEHVAGNISDFVLLMNEKAKELGMNDTHFTNPSGLQDENHYSTAHDLGLLLSAAIKIPLFTEISSSLSFTHAPIRKYKKPNNSNNTMLNTNSLVLTGNKYYYKYATSGKTGHTSDAGYCLAASAKKDDMHLVCVTLNSKSINDRFIDAKGLFNYYFDKYKSLDIRKYDYRFNTPYNNLEINNVSLVKSISITCSDNSSITLPKDISEQNIASKVYFQLKDTSPKDAIGYIEYYFKDNIVGMCDILGENLIISPINVQNLDISSIYNNETDNIEPLQLKRYINKNRLIYYDELNVLRLSNPFRKLLIVLGTIGVLFILGRFTYTKTYININETLNFLYTRFMSKLKRKKKRR